MDEMQCTIKKAVKISGVGLHTGKKVNIEFKAAPANSGINFLRLDLPGHPVIKACTENLLDSSRSSRRTSLCYNGIEVHTVEHLMAVLSGLSIDNLIVEIDADEVPGFDGSGSEFLSVLVKAGKEEQAEARRFYSIKEPVWVEDEQAMIVALPDNDYRISYTLNYNHPMLKAQHMELSLKDKDFIDKVAVSRTFCLEAEAQKLRSEGLGRGADYNNTLVVGNSGVVKNKVRFDDEFVCHKILDLIGDLNMLGVALKARIIALKSGHALNLKLVKKISQQKLRYELGAITAGYSPVTGEEIDTSVIMKILPHRYPFLLVDRIVSMQAGVNAVGIKNVTANEHFFVGHFPGKPIMPGVLIIEAMAQVGGVMMLSLEENRGKLAYFMAVNNVKFRKTVIPGDQLVIKVEVVKIKSRIGQVRAKAFVGPKVVAEADLMFALADS